MKIKRRSLSQAVLTRAKELGLSSLAGTLIAGRISECTDLEKIIHPSLAYLHPPALLKGSKQATKRIILAIQENERIGLVTDYDVDGITSHLVLLESLQFFGVRRERIEHFIGHRLNDGYGLSENLTDRILAWENKPELIITADCGSSDETTIKRLKKAGIDVIVTDHHAIPQLGIPASAYAMINPQQKGCDYPDKTISGCMVAWLLMCFIRNSLIENGFLGKKTEKLTFLLDFVCLSTIADAVSLAGFTNRALVNYGLQLLNSQVRPCWISVNNLLGKKSDSSFTVDDLGFQIGPRINARSRMADPYAALHYLCAASDEDASRWLTMLDQDNEARKKIEQEMLLLAVKMAKEQCDKKKSVLIVADESFYAGVQGIVASRLVDRHGLPAIVLSPGRKKDYYSGSLRSVDGVHVQQALQDVHNSNPFLMESFGGHQGAAGVSMHRESLVEFKKLFEQAVKKQTGGRVLGPRIETDGELQVSEISFKTLVEIENLTPFGRQFEEPVFEGNFTVTRLKAVGADPVHLSLTLTIKNKSFQAIWFRALEQAGDSLPIQINDVIRCVYRLKLNEFRGRKNLQLIVVWAGLAGS